MLDTTDKILASDLVYDIIPKLKATEDLVKKALRDLLEERSSESERSQYQMLQQEFELELMMIYMNLDHLMERYAVQIKAVSEPGAGAVLALDQHESFAIDSAKKLYERVRAIQIDR